MTAWTAGRKIALGSVLLAALLLVSSSLVVAAPLLGHSDRVGGPTVPGPSWGTRPARYALTFAETGLPTNASWSVRLFGASGYPAPRGGSSSNATLVLEVPNGTYNYTLPAVEYGNSVYTSSPASGSVAINGSAASVAVSFSAAPLSVLTFAESGLPLGTFWSVDIAANATPPGWNATPTPLCFGVTYWNGSATTVVEFAVPAGSYDYSIGNVTLNSTEYVPTPSAGNLTLTGTAVTVNVSFASVPLFNLTFDETGLPAGGPNGTWWYAEIANDSTGWLFNASGNSSISFEVPNGAYNFSIGNVTGNGTYFVPTPSAGTVTVADANLTVSIVFSRLAVYNLTFEETGLPNGTFWFASISNDSFGGNTTATTNSSLSFEVPNGTYSFTVGTPFLHPFPGPTAAPLCSHGNGSGNWTYGGYYVATPGSGNVTVNGTNVTVEIAFAPLTYRTVTFDETGLPNGTFWSVQLSGPGYGGWGWGWGARPSWGGWTYWAGSTNSTVDFAVPTGDYNFTIGNLTLDGAEYVASPSNGTVVQNGTDVVVPVAFSRVALFTLTFEETGLPNGTLWSVTIGNASTGLLFGAGWGSAISFLVPNGSYGFSVNGPGNYPPVAVPPGPFCPNGSGGGSSAGGALLPTPPNGTVTVDGANVSVEIAFAPATLYTVTFTESGLPNGTFWQVFGPGAPWGHSGGWTAPGATGAWGGSWNVTGPGPFSTSIQFSLPNGTYHFAIANASVNGTTYVPSPSSVNVTVAGANVSVSVQFADPPGAGSHPTAAGRPAMSADLSAPAMGYVGVGAAAIAALAVGLLLLARRRTPPSQTAPADAGPSAEPTAPGSSGAN